MLTRPVKLTNLPIIGECHAQVGGKIKMAYASFTVEDVKGEDGDFIGMLEPPKGKVSTPSAVIVLRGDADPDPIPSTPLEYPDRDWNPYIPWVGANALGTTRFAVYSPFGIPSKEQHARLMSENESLLGTGILPSLFKDLPNVQKGDAWKSARPGIGSKAAYIRMEEGVPLRMFEESSGGDFFMKGVKFMKLHEECAPVLLAVFMGLQAAIDQFK